MPYVLLGGAAGVLLGFLLPWTIPPGWSPYASAALLAAFAAVMDGVVERAKRTFRAGAALAEFLAQAALAGGLAWLGDRLDIPLYLAVAVFYGSKILIAIGNIWSSWSRGYDKNSQNKEDLIGCDRN